MRRAFWGFWIALLWSLTTVAQAATVSGIVHEGGVKPASTAPAADHRLGDFDSNLGDPLLTILGNTAIYGGVAHRRISKYTDAWSMDFGSAVYLGVFNWQKTSANFDGQLLVNGTQYLLEGSGTLDLGALTGLVTFDLDPIFGRYGPNPDEVATWDLQAVRGSNGQVGSVQASAIPLPPGAVLVLSGLAMLFLVRWRQMV